MSAEDASKVNDQSFPQLDHTVGSALDVADFSEQGEPAHGQDEEIQEQEAAAGGGRSPQPTAAARRSRRRRCRPRPDQRPPDELLHDIIALLPTADGGRTQVLSTRWRPLWPAAPLNFEARAYTEADVCRAAAILRAHRRRGPTASRRFSLRWQCCGPLNDHTAVVDELLRHPALDNLPVLELTYADTFPTPPPPSMFRFSPTLRVLDVSCEYSRIEFSTDDDCCFTALDFPRLEELTLKNVSISESDLHGFLSRCPALQSLVLHYNIGYRLLRITSSTLRSLGITDSQTKKRQESETLFEEVVIEHAPELERLIPDHLMYGLQIRVVHAPKLKILGYLYSGDTTMVFKGMELVSPTNAIRTVKILALDIVPNLDVVIDFLQCFPCVEKLSIAAVTRERLKNVQLSPYTGKRLQVDLITFFLLNARVLKSMTFALGRERDVKWIASQRKKLIPDTRASLGAIICFKVHKYWPSSHVPLKNIHELALDNPFDLESR